MRDVDATGEAFVETERCAANDADSGVASAPPDVVGTNLSRRFGDELLGGGSFRNAWDAPPIAGEGGTSSESRRLEAYSASPR